jgi:hypothetical protein
LAGSRFAQVVDGYDKGLASGDLSLNGYAASAHNSTEWAEFASVSRSVGVTDAQLEALEQVGLGLGLGGVRARACVRVSQAHSVALS